MNSYVPKKEEDFFDLKFVREIARCNRTRMPYILEFSGLPKSGKTTIMRRTLRGLDRLGLRCSTVTEAATTKIDRSLRSDLFVFNMLCYFENLQNLVRESQRSGTFDVVLIDRGVVDSFVWFEFLSKIGLLQKDLREKIENFALLSSWMAHVNHVVYIKSDWRSYKARFLLDSPIQEQPTLSEAYFNILAEAYAELYSKNPPTGLRIQEIDGGLPSDINAENVSAPEILRANWEKAHYSSTEIIVKIFSGIREDNVEYVAVLNSDSINDATVDALKGSKIDEFIATIFDCNNIDPTYGSVQFLDRKVVEPDPSYLQLVAGAYITRDNKFLVLKHAQSEKREDMRGQLTLLVTGHVEKVDLSFSCGAKNAVENCLFRELKEELVNIDWPKVTTKLAIRKGEDEKGRRHLGLIYEVETISPALNVSGLAGAGDFEPDPTFWTLEDMKAQLENFNTWSQHIITTLDEEL